MIVQPPVSSGCWGFEHIHIEPHNDRGHSCFLSRHPVSDVDATSALGVLGGAWADRPNQLCPAGNLESVTRVKGGVRLAGWALAPQARRDFVPVRAVVDYHPAGEAAADVERRDVGRHGFSFTVPADGRPHNACAIAVGVAGGSDVRLGDCHDLPASSRA